MSAMADKMINRRCKVSNNRNAENVARLQGAVNTSHTQWSIKYSIPNCLHLHEISAVYPMSSFFLNLPISLNEINQASFLLCV